MNQLRHSPFRGLNELHQELSRMFDDRYHATQTETYPYENANWVPNINIKETENGFTILADIPGVKKTDVEITVDQSVLSIKGVREEQSESSSETYKRRECTNGTFLRQLTLPESADITRISAKVENGVLEVIIPRSSIEKPRSISVTG